MNNHERQTMQGTGAPAPENGQNRKKTQAQARARRGQGELPADDVAIQSKVVLHLGYVAAESQKNQLGGCMVKGAASCCLSRGGHAAGLQGSKGVALFRARIILEARDTREKVFSYAIERISSLSSCSRMRRDITRLRHITLCFRDTAGHPRTFGKK